MTIGVSVSSSILYTMRNEKKAIGNMCSEYHCMGTYGDNTCSALYKRTTCHKQTHPSSPTVPKLDVDIYPS